MPADKVARSVLESIGNILWVIFVVVTAAQVFFRYVLNAPLDWTEELARFTLVWFTFLGGLLLAIEDDHIRVGFLRERLTGRLRVLAKLVQSVVEMLVGVFLIVGSFTVLLKTVGTSTTALGISLGIWYASSTVAGIGILVSTCSRTWPQIRALVTGKVK